MSSFDILDRKSTERFDREAYQQDKQKPETGKYYGQFDPTAALGQRYTVVLDNNGGTVQGEWITPSAVTSSAKVAVYRGKTGCLFDTL